MSSDSEPTATATATARTSTHHRHCRRPHILLCFSGSVASLKVPQLFVRLLPFADVLLVPSGAPALHFLDCDGVRAATYDPSAWNAFLQANGPSCIVYDHDEWSSWDEIGDPVMHIELRKWADVLLLAPASANTIAKAAAGIADSLMLSCLRAWDLQCQPAVLCPAMNTVMWDHPATRAALAILQNWGWRVVDPVVKTLACQEQGNGALANVEDIVSFVRSLLPPTDDMTEVPIASDETGSDFLKRLLACRNSSESRKPKVQQHRHALALSGIALMVFWTFSQAVAH